MPRNVCPADRIKLEETLLGRWKAREVNRLLYRLEQWAGWSWATEQAIRKAVPYCSQPIRARRVREARAQLPAMLRLPPPRDGSSRDGHRKVAGGLSPHFPDQSQGRRVCAARPMTAIRGQELPWRAPRSTGFRRENLVGKEPTLACQLTRGRAMDPIPE